MNHVHSIPVDPALSVDGAWKELCIFGRRVTSTGPAGWAVVPCDGEECRLLGAAADPGRR